MSVFSSSKKLLLLLLPTFTTTNSKIHQHHHNRVYCTNPKAYFNTTTLSSPSPLSPSPSLSSSPLPSNSSLCVDFLTDSCGLSSEQALRASNEIQRFYKNDGKKPRSVVNFLEATGFSKTHISELVSKQPRLLFADIEKTLKPKFKVFQDLGLSGSGVADLIASKPQILCRSLESHIIPTLDFIRSFVETEGNLIKAITRPGFLLTGTSSNQIQPNINILREHGVSNSDIVSMFMMKPGVLMVKTGTMQEIIVMLDSFGFKTESKMYTAALRVMCSMKKATLDSKVELLKNLGWSEVQIFDSFRRAPIILSCSGKKLKLGIEFYAKNLKWDSSVLSKYPLILLFSLKGRVIPRFIVYKVLMSKKIVKEDKKLISMLLMTEKTFLSKYVFKYQEELPYLIESYKNGCILGDEEGRLSNGNSGFQCFLNHDMYDTMFDVCEMHGFG